MKIHTFSTEDGGLAPNLRAIARIRHPMPAKQGKMREDWHPVIFHAATEEAAYEAAQTWWDDFIAKEQAKRERAQARGDSRKKVPAVTALEVGAGFPIEMVIAEPEDDDPGPIL